MPREEKEEPRFENTEDEPMDPERADRFSVDEDDLEFDPPPSEDEKSEENVE